MNTTHTVNAHGTALSLSGYAEAPEPDAGLTGGAFVDAVNGVELDLPSCPFSEASTPETDRVLRAAGVPDGVTLDDLCRLWLDAELATRPGYDPSAPF